jgi:hypothetical protein
LLENIRAIYSNIYTDFPAKQTGSHDIMGYAGQLSSKITKRPIVKEINYEANKGAILHRIIYRNLCDVAFGEYSL